MNLSKSKNLILACKLTPRRSIFFEVIFRQSRRAYLDWEEYFMPLLFNYEAAFCSVKHYRKGRRQTDRQILPSHNRVMT